MPTKLNLATKPFSNRSLPWVVTAVVMVVSVLFLFVILRSARQTSGRADAIQVEINSLNAQEHALRQKAEAVRSSLTADQLQALSAAHTLVDRKQFSWSRLFVDLEAALPGVVRVKRIAVRGVATRGDQTFADLELTVVAKTPSIVTDMIAQMDQDGVFHAELRSQTLQRGRGETGAEYELAVNYKPRAGAPVDSVALSGSLAKGVDAQ